MAKELSFGLQYVMGSHKGPNPPIYCRHCMNVMIVTRRKTGYDPNFGQPLYEMRATCSAPWWRKFGFHDSLVQDRHGDWPYI